MDKIALAQKINSLTGLSKEEKAELTQLLHTKRYGLVWEDKPEAVEEELKTQLPVLHEVTERKIIGSRQVEVGSKPVIETIKPQISLDFGVETDTINSVQKDIALNTQNVNHALIEGDNLHALTVLNYTHANKIDVIYIDPPYNTGNKDFKYNDSFVDKEDGYRHSKWLSFMAKRLRLAKNLLSDKGVIFISIDDNEQAQLKLLCDEVFGEMNGLGPIIQNKQNAKNDSVNIQKNHEYIFVYKKLNLLDEKGKTVSNLINNEVKIKNIFKENDTYFYLNDSITTRGDGGILNARPNLGHTIYYNPKTNEIIAVCDYDVELAKTSNDLNAVYSTSNELVSKGYLPIRPPKVRGKLGCWTWSLEKINSSKNELIVTGKSSSFTIKKRTFVDKSCVLEENGKLIYYSFEKSNSRSIIDYSTNDGTNVLNEVLSKSDVFNNPKNLEMLKYLVKLVPNPNLTILDFFAGSGTTLQAVMALNAEDGGSRQCILVTNNENNICEEVTYERNKRVIEGYTNAKGDFVAGLGGNNLRYYRTGYVGREKTLKNKKALVNLASEMLCLKEGVYQENIEKAHQQIRVFEENDKAFMIIYDEEYIDEAILLIQQIEIPNPIKVYIFANGQYPYTEDFEEVLDKIELCALPDAIYRAYQRLLPKEEN